MENGLRHDVVGRPLTQECNGDDDCGESAICLATAQANLCFERCGLAGPCRVGWVCDQRLGVDFEYCLPDCFAAGCDDGYVCDDFSGLCRVPVVTVAVEQLFLAPGKSDGTQWDGFGDVPPQVVAQAAQLLAGPGVVGALVGYFGSDALQVLAKPDPAGVADLRGPWDDLDLRIGLAERADTFTPVWDVEWTRVPLGPEHDVRVRLNLWDVDVLNDDDIGVVTISGDDLRAAFAAGNSHPVVVNDQGVGHVLLVTISVFEE